MMITRMVSLLPCILVIELASVEKANIVMNIIQFIQLPFVLIPALKFITSEDIMGEYVLKGKRLRKIIGLTCFLVLLNAFQLSGQFPQTNAGIFSGFVFMLAYFGSLVYLIRKKLQPIKVKKKVNEIELLSFGC